MKSWNPPTRIVSIGILLCLVYYFFICWFSYHQLTVHFTMWLPIMFASGFAGIQISVWMLIPFTKDVRRALGFLLGINGVISGFTSVITGYSSELILAFLVFGLAQFFYFACSDFEKTE